MTNLNNLSRRQQRAVLNGEKPTALLGNSTYDVLNNITKILLPGLGALYFALAAIWGFPYAEQVVGSIAAITVFLGLFLLIADNSYNKVKWDGAVVVVPEAERMAGVPAFDISLEKDLRSLKDGEELKLKVLDPSGAHS